METLGPRRLTTVESLAMLRDSFADDNTCTDDRDAAYAVADPSPIHTDASRARVFMVVALRRSRIVGTALLLVFVLLTLTEIFRRGVALETFDKATKTAAQRSAMLDTYNSYSGNAAAALGRPVELVLAVLAQVIVLRFVAASIVRPQLRMRIVFAALALSAIVGFFINSGFNALNVQLLDIETRPVIVRSDLSVTTDVNLRSIYAATTSNVSQSVSETQARNPITNTVLRNLVLTREPKAPPLCTKSYNENLRFPDDVIDYGFPQRDWMKRMLPEAPAAQQLRMVMNATDERVNHGVSSDKLPMNASRAADLFLTSVLLSYSYIPWSKSGSWLDTYNTTRFGELSSTLPTTAIVAGLLPPNGSQATEQQQRDWFLRESRRFLNTRAMKTENLSRTDVGLEFAHVDLSPTISFDSVTWDVEVEPTTLATTIAPRDADGKTTRYTVLSADECGPWPAVCLVPRQETDTPVVIHVFAVCANADGSETLRSAPKGTTMYDYFVQCPSTTNNSLLVVSATKRLVADALHENATANATGVFPTDNGNAVITNLRKIYTFTVGRLGWTWQNLAEKYGAACHASLHGECDGLDFELVGETEPKQHLLVGAASVPLGLVNGPYYDATFREVDQHPVPIVTIVEPSIAAAGKPRWQLLAGDYLLRHNIGNLTWDMRRRQRGQQCAVVQEDRAQLVLNNHLYMETTLQSTYTAALFFLFQNGVVKDALSLDQHLLQTLVFDGNVQNVAVQISIPASNAVLTYVGCLVVTIALAVALLWSQLTSQNASDDPLQAIDAPHVMARVMLDDRTFPSLLLHRRVVSTSANGHKCTRPADEYLIRSVELAYQGGRATVDEDRASTASISNNGISPRPTHTFTGFGAA